MRLPPLCVVAVKNRDNHKEVGQGTRRTCDASFLRHAVELARQEGNAVKGIAHNLGVGRATLENRPRAAEEHGPRAFPGHGKARFSPEQEKIKRLKKEIETLHQEREI